ncbi:MAG: DNA repair protein RecO [Planctomycetota bacterium]|jgi:DNA repair protein RecO (recombination protein O)
MLTKDVAICIHAVDYSETSQIVTFFTKETGRISVIAKGSKRPKSRFDGTIEVFSHGRIVFSSRNKESLATLTEFEQQPGLTRLGNNILALNCCLFGAEILSNLTNEYDPHPQLFDSFLGFLQNVESVTERRSVLSLLILFQLDLLKEIGLQPVLNKCVNCKTDFTADWQQCYFSSSANGLICRDCENSFPDKMRLSQEAVNCLCSPRLLAELKERTLGEIEKILVYHFTELFHKPPKMAKYILQG